MILKRSCSCVLAIGCFMAATGLAIAQNEVVLHSFELPPKGANPSSGVVRDKSGNFYGTTSAGGQYNQGVTYKLSASGRVTVLYNFTGGADGGNPEAGVVLDSAGNLYGVCASGGSGGGLVYKLDNAGDETVLHRFGETINDGDSPQSGVVLDTEGNLYGTTFYGGAFGAGTVYKLTSSGEETVLHTFTGGADGGGGTYGGGPAGLIIDAAGNLYGTTGLGGSGSSGVVFEISAAGQETVLYNFTGGADGGYPNGVIRDPEGTLYGVADGGGTGYGVVFKISRSGKETVLYSFTGGSDGFEPQGGLVRDASGNLYGTTVFWRQCIWRIGVQA